MAVRSPQDVYARHLSSSRGYPMWTPEPSSQLLSYRPEGLRIGDVGVVVPENGNFDVFFNICLSKDHHFHQLAGVPDDFSPVELSDADIRTISNAESARQVIAASSVTEVGSDEASVSGEVLPRTRQPGATGYTFNLSSSEGAVLVLPDGAESHDVRDPRPFLEQASRHAATWYHFAEENLGRIISHDSIYVITGFHKAPSWGLAGYQNGQGNGDFSARFTLGAREGGKAGYGWETTRSMDYRVGPLDGLGISNQSVFIRGFKIALRSSVQGVPQKWASFASTRSDVQSSSGDSWLSNAWRGFSNSIGMGRDENVGAHVEIQRVPEILPVFHPSDVINRYILQKDPSAKVAITHDNDWGSILDKNLLTQEELVQDELLTKMVSERYTIVSREGVAYLRGNSGPDLSIDAATDDMPPIEAANEAPMDGIDKKIEATGECVIVQPSQPQSLSVVSESNYRCLGEGGSRPIAAESRPADLQSIPSGFGPGVDAPTSSESLRHVKIIVISDFLCAFCYVCDKVLRDAIEACRDLPIRFDLEFRPFSILSPPTTSVSSRVIYRNAYLAKRFGKEKAEMKLKAANELAQNAGLKLADDGIVCRTIQAHRLSTKAYQDGGQDLQYKLNTHLFDVCLARGADISDEALLVEAAVETGFMSKEKATEFLRSTECFECVEKMMEAARAQGIVGVPFVIIDGKWAVNGHQPLECFIQIFRKLAHRPASTVPSKTKGEREN